MTNAQKPVAPATPEAPTTPTAGFTPELTPPPSAREQELLDEIAKLKAAAIEPSEALSAAAKRVKDAYKVPKGEEGYHHVLITKQGGEDLAEPIVKPFDAHQYETSISKLPGFHGEIIHEAKK